MFCDPMYAVRQLLIAFSRTPHVTGSHGVPIHPAHIGCCPACHDFVRVNSWERTGDGVCPSCGRRIKRLDALGSSNSLGATDEL